MPLLLTVRYRMEPTPSPKVSYPFCKFSVTCHRKQSGFSMVIRMARTRDEACKAFDQARFGAKYPGAMEKLRKDRFLAQDDFRFDRTFY